ncbi:MAG: BA14K family protein [Hyphomonadaceae bacterium]|nr:BA14K family protein [Hyphomonadaceae bacterium]
MRRLLAGAVAALLLSTSAFAPFASAQGRRGDEPPPPYQYWENRRDPPPGHEFHARRDPIPRWEDRNHPPPNWNRHEWELRQRWLRRNRHDDDDHDSAAGLVLGVILGFALGAAVVDSQEQQTYATSRLNDPGWIAYCARRYRSFDPYTGTYLGYDGLRHYCR